MAISAKNKAKLNDEDLKPISENNITALYVRVSTEFQFEEGYSLEAQIKKLKQWCELKDYHNYKVYQDGGWSGSNIHRPAMEKMISDIKQKRIKRVVVYKLDRLSRSQKDTLFLLEEVFIPNDIEFVSINENFDTSSPYGKAMIGILSVFAQLERENIRERTRMGMYERVKDGWWPGGGNIPFGYDYDANKNTLVVNEHSNEVKQIYSLYLQGYTTTQLCTMFPVCSDRQISNILSRRTYLGEIEYNGEIFKGRHEPLIDRETWERVQALREKRSVKREINRTNLLTGLLVCGKCGAKMRYQKWTKDTYKIWCYSQDKSKPYLVKDPNCNNMKCDADAVEKAVIDDLLKISESISADGKFQFQKISKETGLQTLTKKKELIQLQVKKLYGLYAAEEDSLLLETISDLKKDLEVINKMIVNEQKKVSVEKGFVDSQNTIKNLKNRWPTMSREEQRRAVRMCIDKVVITDGEINIHYLF